MTITCKTSGPTGGGGGGALLMAGEAGDCQTSTIYIYIYVHNMYVYNICTYCIKNVYMYICIYTDVCMYVYYIMH